MISPGHVVRPCRAGDLDALVRLTRRLGPGVTTLPADPDDLAARIQLSEESFARRVTDPGAERYLLVLADAATDEPVGTAALIARVGGFDPSYTYELRRERRAHAPLAVDRTIAVLHLRRDHKGPTELASLALDPALRGRGLARPLSLARLLLMAAFPERFAGRVITELRGQRDDAGRSPFWERVGRRFFDRDFEELDVLTGLGRKDFIADLLPPHPIVVDLLPDEVRAVIGRTHRDARPAERMLTGEGLAFAGEVDIFDAGPVLAADRSAIRTIRDHRRLTVAEPGANPPGGPPLLVAAPRLDFRALAAPVAETPDATARVAPEAMTLLGVSPGDAVLVVALGAGAR